MSQAEADEKLADYIDGRNWKEYTNGKTEFYLFNVREREREREEGRGREREGGREGVREGGVM